MQLNRLYEIAELLNLGKVAESPRPLSGGFMHSMFSLFTDRGKYAIKLLNPHIMARPDAMDNFLQAETLEAQLEQAGVSILPARTFGGRKMQEINGQFFYIFDWFDGHALSSAAVCEDHCRAIAAQLARIHAIDHRSRSYKYHAESIDWEYYVHQLTAKNPELSVLLTGNLDILRATEEHARAAYANLPQTAAICHNDMDCKNVLWNKDDFRIIDLECLSWGNPSIELYETALYWSGIEQCRVDPDRFSAFIRAYESEGGELPHSWSAVHDVNCGRLHWLVYNLRRALGIDCSSEEIAIGESEIRKTIPQLVHYSEIRKTLP